MDRKLSYWNCEKKKKPLKKQSSQKYTTENLSHFKTRIKPSVLVFLFLKTHNPANVLGQFLNVATAVYSGIL